MTAYPGLLLSLSTPLDGFGPMLTASTVGPVRSTSKGTSRTGPHRPSESLLWTYRWCTPSDIAATVAARMVASTETNVAVRFRVITIPEPFAPTESTKYSAAVIVPPAAESSPVAERSTSALPLAGVSVNPLVVAGPVFGRWKTTELTTPQLPAESRART